MDLSLRDLSVHCRSLHISKHGSRLASFWTTSQARCMFFFFVCQVVHLFSLPTARCAKYRRVSTIFLRTLYARQPERVKIHRYKQSNVSGFCYKKNEIEVTRIKRKKHDDLPLHCFAVWCHAEQLIRSWWREPSQARDRKPGFHYPPVTRR